MLFYVANCSTLTENSDWRLCRARDDDDCDFVYIYHYNKEKVKVQRTKGTFIYVCVMGHKLQKKYKINAFEREF